MHAEHEKITRAQRHNGKESIESSSVKKEKYIYIYALCNTIYINNGCMVLVFGVAPPPDRLQGVQHKPGHSADRILRAIRPALQLPENGNPCEERRSVPRQGGDD